MSGNYPAGVTDNDPYFNDCGSPGETEAQYSTRLAREWDEQHKDDVPHSPDCKCSECECPF